VQRVVGDVDLQRLNPVEASLPQLLDTNVAATAMTLEQHLPSLHAGALSLLDGDIHVLGYMFRLGEKGCIGFVEGFRQVLRFNQDGEVSKLSMSLTIQ
jgi:hypothetical protein